MYFFLQLHVCICMYIFSVDSLKFVIKEFSGQPTPPPRGVQPDGIYNVPLYRVWCSSSSVWDWV